MTTDSLNQLLRHRPNIINMIDNDIDDNILMTLLDPKSQFPLNSTELAHMNHDSVVDVKEEIVQVFTQTEPKSNKPTSSRDKIVDDAFKNNNFHSTQSVVLPKSTANSESNQETRTPSSNHIHVPMIKNKNLTLIQMLLHKNILTMKKNPVFMVMMM